MAEKNACTSKKNNNNQKRSRCAQRVGLPYDSEQMRYDGKNNKDISISKSSILSQRDRASEIYASFAIKMKNI